MTTEGWSVGIANLILKSISKQVPFSVSALWIQMHTGRPGAAGTLAVAVNTTRIAATSAFSVDPATGLVSTSSNLVWPTVPATETYAFATAWDSSTSGTFICSGTITNGSATAGNDFTLPSGGLVLSLPVATT